MSHVDTITLPEKLYVAVQINDGCRGGVMVSDVTTDKAEVIRAATREAMNTPGWPVGIGVVYEVCRLTKDDGEGEV